MKVWKYRSPLDPFPQLVEEPCGTTPQMFKHAQNEPDKLIAERDTTHGPYDRTAARAQTLKTATREGTNWGGMEPWARESLEMIEHKRARILEGNWREVDHWLDIAGYAMLVVNLLREH